MTNGTARRRSTRSAGGQATVELAFAIPIVVVFLMAVFQVAFIARDQVLTVHAARAAAREAAVAADGGRIRARATDVLDGAEIEVWRGARIGDDVVVDGALRVEDVVAVDRCLVPGSGTGGPGCDAARAMTRRRSERGAATPLVAVVIVFAMLAATAVARLGGAAAEAARAPRPRPMQPRSRRPINSRSGGARPLPVPLPLKRRLTTARSSSCAHVAGSAAEVEVEIPDSARARARAEVDFSRVEGP